MKRIYSIITLLLLAGATFVSCSEDEKMNTSNATVSFFTAEHSVKESKGIFNVPVIVTGEQNGPIEVNIEVSSNDANCKEDVHYLITSKKLIIPANKKEVNVEIKAVDDRIINEDRHFSLHIASTNGATIDSNHATANIILMDNDDIPYERMSGVWTVTAKNLLSESGEDPISWEMNLNIVDDDDPSYGSVITSTPWAAWDGSIPVFDENGQTLSHTMSFYHNESTGKTTVDMKMGTIMASNLNFGTAENGADLSNATIRSATMGLTGLMYTGNITGIVNDDFTEIKFSNPVYLIIYSTAGNPTMYYGGFDNITLKLKK